MATRIEGDLVLNVHTAKAPSDLEWQEYLRECTAIRPRIRNLVFTDGGGPNVLQRKQALDAVRGASVRVAVVSSSVLVRGIVTAISWFGVDIRAFAPTERNAAYRFLNLSNVEIERVVRHMLSMQTEVGVSIAAVQGDVDPPAMSSR